MATLITGGTGFIGSEVARVLVDRGEGDVTLFDITDSTHRLEDIAAKVEVIRGDVGNISHVLDAVQQSSAKVVYHLGAMLSLPSDSDPSAAMRTNAIGTFNVMEAARLLGVEKVIFSSSIGTYASGITEETIDDLTLQRPQFFYGACKLFGEHTGLFYKRKYGIDYRGIRYPVIVGPGVRSPGAAQYNSWVIEESAKGKPFSVWVKPEQRASLVYFKDAARATVALADAPVDRIEMVNYLISGTSPRAADLVDMVRRKVPGAEIDFAVNEEIQAILDEVLRPIDDRFACSEWGWEPTYDLEQMVDDFLRELRDHPLRYP
jgi:threonine 3-dehydrogenase